METRFINAFEFRNKSLGHQDFGNYAMHDSYAEIPDGEVWMSDHLDPYEIRIFKEMAEYEQKWLQSGVSPQTSYENSVRFGNLLRVPQREPVQYEFYFAIHEVVVDIVDGRHVRDKHHSQFTQGGHGHVYEWLRPKNEIWIERLQMGETPFIVIHELTELLLMRDRGWSYAKAHMVASDVERWHRLNFPGLGLAPTNAVKDFLQSIFSNQGWIHWVNESTNPPQPSWLKRHKEHF